MARSAREAVFEGLELLPGALIPFVEKRLDASLKGHWQTQVERQIYNIRTTRAGDIDWDQLTLLRSMTVFWKESFADVLGPAHRSMVSELIEVRNRHAHNDKFSYDDAERALDSMRRLCEAISAGEIAAQLGSKREAILRIRFQQQSRTDRTPKTSSSNGSGDSASNNNGTGSKEASGNQLGLKSWRELVEPHEDVAEGNFQQAEFAADLAKVHNGSASSEYLDPREFYSRTFLTQGLSQLLTTAARRLSGLGGDPVVELQTNFGGGKTHSMLALYHLAGKVSAQDLPGLDQLLASEGLEVPDKINRAVLVGTSRGPSEPFRPKGGPEIHTTWGEMAWQLGGQKAYDLVAENDVRGIAPGSQLLEDIFRKSAPNLILIDEWVVYLRQIYKVEGLGSGNFDANISFVQSLTEAVKASPQTLLVAALPASQIETGGEGGQEALTRLKQTFSRLGTVWRPASQEESYELVRRRLFKELPGNSYKHRDQILKHFAKMYRDQPHDFPEGSADENYRRKMEKAWPVHPELFDQLYTAWGSQEKFQRTRGVLRLMAKVIHQVWMSSDSSPMIMPGSVLINSAVQSELLHYLELSWDSIIAGDIDGEASIPYQIDKSAPNLNRYAATRRVARTIFMGTAPLHAQENKGLYDRQINLGVVQPGEKSGIFGDALRHLRNRAKFLHGDQSGRYWYSLAASLNREAQDRAEQMEKELILLKINESLKDYITSQKESGNFDAVQALPGSSAEVPDEPGGVRIVILGVEHAHQSSDSASAAMGEIKDIVLNCGKTSRVNRNTLVFLVPVAPQLDDLQKAMRLSLAWSSMLSDGTLDLRASEAKQASEKLQEVKDTVLQKLKDAWCYLIYPSSENALADTEYLCIRVAAEKEGILKPASKKLLNEEALLVEIGPRSLQIELEGKGIWQERDHLLLKDVWGHLNRHLYLPRLKGREVLQKTVQSAISGGAPGPFAYAEAWDERTGQYSGLAISNSAGTQVVIDDHAVLLRPEVAEKHKPAPASPEEPSPEGPKPDTPQPGGLNEPEARYVPPDPTRFTGTIELPPDRPIPKLDEVMQEVIDKIRALSGARVCLTLEIEADVAAGIPKETVRVLDENTRSLGFKEKKFS